MEKKALFLTILFGGALFAGFVNAEIYKYKDPGGHTHFTNDLSVVPIDQRPQVESFKEIVSKETNTLHSDGETKTHQEQNEASDFSAPESEDLSDLKKINERKSKLDKEYAQLVTEKEALLKEKEEADTRDAQKICNEKSVELNERIAQYETRRQAFEKEAEEFNKRH